MRNRNLITALMAGGLALAATQMTAQGTVEALPPQGDPQLGHHSQSSKEATAAGAPSAASELKASSIIGLLVRNESGERLGKASDLIVSMTSQSVPFAIVEYGGALGIGATRVAVPLSNLKLANEPRELILTATKEQFQSASAVPTGGWAAVASEDWLKTVDRFYGQPTIADQSRFERQEANGLAEGRESVRTPSEQKGATGLQDQRNAISPGSTNLITTLSDDYVLSKVKGVINQDEGSAASNIKVTVKNGVVTVKGKIANDAQKKMLVNQIKGLPGVDRVDDNGLGVSAK